MPNPRLKTVYRKGKCKTQAPFILDGSYSGSSYSGSESSSWEIDSKGNRIHKKHHRHRHGRHRKSANLYQFASLPLVLNKTVKSSNFRPWTARQWKFVKLGKFSFDFLFIWSLLSSHFNNGQIATMKNKLGSNAYLIKIHNNSTLLHWFTCLYFPVEPICAHSLPIGFSLGRRQCCVF